VKVLKGILKESKEHYLKVNVELKKEFSKLPKGSIKKRKIGGHFYYYLQYREKDKILHKYLGKNEPEDIINKIKRRNVLKNELKKVKEALKLLSKIK